MVIQELFEFEHSVILLFYSICIVSVTWLKCILAMLIFSVAIYKSA